VVESNRKSEVDSRSCTERLKRSRYRKEQVSLTEEGARLYNKERAWRRGVGTKYCDKTLESRSVEQRIVTNAHPRSTQDSEPQVKIWITKSRTAYMFA
jgi:hypothetical protein